MSKVKKAIPASEPTPAPAPGPSGSSSANSGRPDVPVVLPAAFALLAALLLLVLKSPARVRGQHPGAHEQVAPAGRQAEAPAAGPVPGTPAPDLDGIAVLGYASVADGLNGSTGDELRTQAETIARECKRRGFVLLEVIRERQPQRGKWHDRPGLGYALRRIADGEANGLVVAELTRVSRSVAELGEVLEWFYSSDARLVAAAHELDTGEGAGAITARTLMALSTWERERLGERTRKGLETARRKGRPGVADHPELRERIARMRAEGMTFQAIADRLNAEGVPTVRGGAKWRASSMQATLGYRRPRRGTALGDGRRGDGGGEEN